MCACGRGRVEAYAEDEVGRRLVFELFGGVSKLAAGRFGEQLFGGCKGVFGVVCLSRGWTVVQHETNIVMWKNNIPRHDRQNPNQSFRIPYPDTKYTHTSPDPNGNSAVRVHTPAAKATQSSSTFSLYRPFDNVSYAE